jgi:hypothetical protein
MGTTFDQEERQWRTKNTEVQIAKRGGHGKFDIGYFVVIYIYVNIMNGSLCGTDPISPLEPPPVSCQAPAGYRLIIEHVSGYAFLPAPADTTVGMSIAIKDPKLGFGGTGELAFHTFVATKTSTAALTDVLSFSSPFKMMWHGGAIFYLTPANNAAVSGYLVKE